MEKKHVVVCVCGGIAAYKVVEVVSRLTKLEAHVQVAMTQSAQEFVTPLTFQTIAKNKVHTSLVDEGDGREITHI